jgi:hypothetical protein
MDDDDEICKELAKKCFIHTKMIDCCRDIFNTFMSGESVVFITYRTPLNCI